MYTNNGAVAGATVAGGGLAVGAVGASGTLPYTGMAVGGFIVFGLALLVLGFILYRTYVMKRDLMAESDG